MPDSDQNKQKYLDFLAAQGYASENSGDVDILNWAVEDIRQKLVNSDQVNDENKQAIQSPEFKNSLLKKMFYDILETSLDANPAFYGSEFEKSIEYSTSFEETLEKMVHYASVEPYFGLAVGQAFLGSYTKICLEFGVVPDSNLTQLMFN